MTTDQFTRQLPRTSALDRPLAMRLAATEYERFAAMLAVLTPDQWVARTDCPAWDVRDMAGHVLGMAQMAASLPEMMRQQVGSMRRQKRDGGLTIDALTALQVEKNAGLSTDEVIEAMRTIGPRAARGRRRTPGVVRNRAVPEEQDVAGDKEWWTFGYVLDTILTRDPFMHRVDIARATGAELTLTEDHEGVIVDDVVREWADRHGQNHVLELTGPAGGRWERGAASVTRMDAVDFCRTLSGRAPADGLLAVQVPF